MPEPYVGEIRMFGGNFAPQGWAFCDGALLPISENDALFSLIGTTYGGDGQQTFKLPDLRGRVPLHQGQGPGLSNHTLGQMAGTETETVTISQMPNHTHPFQAVTDPANQTDPTNNFLAQSKDQIYTSDLSQPATMDATSISGAGGSQPHDNMMPFLAVTFIIALYGIYPSRN